jgi:hypothetical protein
MSAETSLFGWDQPMHTTKVKRGQPKCNLPPSTSSVPQAAANLATSTMNHENPYH